MLRSNPFDFNTSKFINYLLNLYTMQLYTVVCSCMYNAQATCSSIRPVWALASVWTVTGSAVLEPSDSSTIVRCAIAWVCFHQLTKLHMSWSAIFWNQKIRCIQIGFHASLRRVYRPAVPVWQTIDRLAYSAYRSLMIFGLLIRSGFILARAIAWVITHEFVSECNRVTSYHLD